MELEVVMRGIDRGYDGEDVVFSWVCGWDCGWINSVVRLVECVLVECL
jgi:hypothetical protein